MTAAASVYRPRHAWAGEPRQVRAAVKRTLTWLRAQCELSQWFWLQRDFPASIEARIRGYAS